ncbi:UDP-2,4-diacetamido-2,4,6-trideoxy-beta-L-altropyranose hydrolase [Hydrogenophaga sp.]|uniref:UDP-2,4-diacetamido-2,4, 6-trideoxy-beta-L-altropyranose hydrolase n=1 Tax=Hydrogenophaga sp. TaxID=1904254 RepID=UPI002728137B|nr:UDP-2,4-diacetamido-2,4,6-trideoxy-beta-L-altropyranose hydrolase [Hydrogenophaga sp.]MDO9438421.1 UDP-2,4-diacetamido-2,4,6-trideoxy-beta-L-altropyranose hydrolase [Hydrogenophaga sp.]
MTSVVFRADASLDIGSGHIMRCLTLAERIRAQGGRSLFVCRAHHGHMAAAIQLQGHDVVMLNGDTDFPADTALAPWRTDLQEADARDTVLAVGERVVDWLVTDHYGLDATWERVGAQMSRRRLAIDDLCNRSHDVELLLDQNLGRTPSDYIKLLPTDCHALTGPWYALLRSEFAQQRAASLRRRDAVQALQHIVVSMGGTDPVGATGMVLASLQQDMLPRETRITIVMGASAPSLEAVKNTARSLPWPAQVVVNTTSMAELLAEADLALGAAGGSAWERCCLGVPSVIVVMAENQRPAAHALARADCALLIDSTDRIPAELGPCLRALQAPGRLGALSTSSAVLADGLGAQRVLDAMMGHS